MARHQPRHRHVRSRGRRVPRIALVAAPLALASTGAAVGLGVLRTDVVTPEVSAVDAPRVESSVSRQPIASRSDRRAGRPTPPTGSAPAAIVSPADKLLRSRAVARAIRGARDVEWTTTELNLWTRPDQRAEQLGVLDAATQVRVTGRQLAGRQEIVINGKPRWVTIGYLDEEKPSPEPTLGGSCSNGTSVPAGVSSNIRAIHQAVCSNFPEIVTYGTLRSDGEHAQGIAVDIMVSGDRGWEVAEFVRRYYSELGVNYVIHARRIWSVDRSGEGWRSMADRGSVTANHYDHVHVTTY